jgi:hypothetical protein
MDLPCPQCKSTALQNVSLACEGLLHRCGSRAQFHGGLVGNSGLGILVGISTTKGTRQTTLNAQSGETGTCPICRNISVHVLYFETSVAQIPVATAAFKSSPAARQQNRVAGRTCLAES